MIDSQRFIARKAKIIVLLNVMVETIVEVEMSVMEITYVIESCMSYVNCSPVDG